MILAHFLAGGFLAACFTGFPGGEDGVFVSFSLDTGFAGAAFEGVLLSDWDP